MKIYVQNWVRGNLLGLEKPAPQRKCQRTSSQAALSSPAICKPQNSLASSLNQIGHGGKGQLAIEVVVLQGSDYSSLISILGMSPCYMLAPRFHQPELMDWRKQSMSKLRRAT